MGNQCARSVVSDPASPLSEHLQLQDTPVHLHLYDLGTTCTGQALNSILRPLGTPALHCGVEVLGHEWSFCFLTKDGDPYQGSGIFSSKPGECEGHSYSQSMKLGYVLVSKELLRKLLKEMEMDWLAIDYDIFSRNCCHFANELCSRLGVGELPGWVMRLTQVGHALSERQCVSAGALCCGWQGQGVDKLDKHDALDHAGLCCLTTEEDGPGRFAPRVQNTRRPDPWNDDVIAGRSGQPPQQYTGINPLLAGVEEIPWADGEWEHWRGIEAFPVVKLGEYAPPSQLRGTASRSRSRGQGLPVARSMVVQASRRE